VIGTHFFAWCWRALPRWGQRLVLWLSNTHFLVGAVALIWDDPGRVLAARHTYRLGPHSKSDDTRDPAEIARHRERDPLSLTRQGLDPSEAERIDAAARDRIRDAFANALNASASVAETFG